MLSRTTLIAPKAAAAMGLLLFFTTSCQHHTAPPADVAAAAGPPKVKYNETYDPDIKEILELASKDRWEEAQAKAEALFLKAPQDQMVRRIHTWVLDAGKTRRDQAVEDKIREIDAKNSVFSPTVP